MKRLFIIAGHGGTDSGATATTNGVFYREANLTVEIRDLIITECNALGISNIITDSNSNALAATLNWLKSLVFSKDSILIDLHWNASDNITANGTENFIPDNYTSKELTIANEIHRVFTNVGFRSRGVKTESQSARKRLGIFRPDCEQVLIEVGFISNSRDMLLYENNKQTIAKEIAKILKNHIGGVQEHIVKSGENLWSIARIYKTTPQVLAEKNNISTNSILKIGQKLKI